MGAPAAPPPAERPAPTRAARPAGGHAIQVGAFGDRNSAQELVETLRKASFSAYVVEDTFGSARFKVRVGPFAERGKAEAATLLADAEVERAKGVAQANEIIADSLTDEYIRWLYVDQLDQTNGQIIYIPTEAGLPILEAGNR